MACGTMPWVSACSIVGKAWSMTLASVEYVSLPKRPVLRTPESHGPVPMIKRSERWMSQYPSQLLVGYAISLHAMPDTELPGQWPGRHLDPARGRCIADQPKTPLLCQF